MAEALTILICRRCGHEVPIDLVACLAGHARWPLCCDQVMSFVTPPTPAQIEAVAGPLLTPAITAVLARRDRVERADA